MTSGTEKTNTGFVLYFCLFVVICKFSVCDGLGVAPRYEHACYGISAQSLNFLEPNCPAGRIVIGYFKAGSKFAQGTPLCNATTPDIIDLPGYFNRCCVYDQSSPSDRACFLEFENRTAVAEWAYTCLASPQCWTPFADHMIRASFMSTTGKCATQYFRSTHYETMEYYCIPDEDAVTDRFLPHKESTTAANVYLVSSGYGTRSAALRPMTCSVQTQCGDVIDVTLLDVRLKVNSTQAIILREVVRNTTVNWLQNTLFVNPRVLITTMSNFLVITVTNTDGAPGNFSMEFSSRGGHDMTLACDGSAATEPPVCQSTALTSNTPTVDGTNVTTTPIVDGTSSVTSVTNGASSGSIMVEGVSDSSDYPFLAPFVVATVMLTSMMIVVFIAIKQRWWNKKWWRWKNNGVADITPSPAPVSTLIDKTTRKNSQLSPINDKQRGSIDHGPDERRERKKHRKKKKKHSIIADEMPPIEDHIEN